MALEDITAGATIASLVTTNPADGDDVAQGDDHIRNIKKALQFTFPNISATVSGVAAELAFAHKGGTVSGNAVILGTLSVSGALVVNNNFRSEGVTSLGAAVVMGSTLSVSGATTLKGTLTVSATMIALGNVGIVGSLGVQGATTLSGATTLKGTLTAESAATLASTLSVSGATHLKTTLSAGGAATLASTLTVEGATTLKSSLSVSGAVNMATTLSAGGAATLASTLSVSGATTLKSTLSAGGAVTLGSTLSVSGAFVAKTSATIEGTATVSGTLVALTKIVANALSVSATATLMATDIIDNAITAAKIATGAVGQDEIAASAVGQGELKTTTGTVSNNTGASNFTLPGGEYGFYPQLRTTDGGAAGSIMLGSGFTNTTFTTLIYLDRGGAAIVVAQQRYVQASPPYEPYRAGDQVPIFVFALIDKTTGNVVATYTAEDPPWANNGPTVINPLGRKQRLVRQRVQAAVAAGSSPEDAWIAVSAWMNDAANLPQIVAAMLAPIPQAEKNADMALIPHPFGSFDPATHVVAVLSPTNCRFCCALHARFVYGGDSIAEMLHSGHIAIGNTPIPGCTTPPSVMAVTARLK